MTKTDTIRQATTQALKDHDKERREALSMILSALKLKAIDKREPLTPEEEDQVILKEIKQMQETIDTAPADRLDIIDKAKQRIAIYEEFAPKQMNAEEVKEEILAVFAELNLDAPTGKDKGIIMKNLMPKLKGKADGALINQVLAQLLS